ncbi:hypothetical protein O166_20635 [Pseudogulbenkiania ferrooxidans EGD-HP2]|uniref:Uncharacterized protein n=1 Tax=Pseudogulbenkiania ferrooxidans EGD-HP2 TaxID=1388764 RepID=A0ABN0NB85_9NEIS|nr:hypothetical protein O166_20635 [Pseudogulbenkiania ferrooxidans EGD-HP2]
MAAFAAMRLKKMAILAYRGPMTSRLRRPLRYTGGYPPSRRM